MTPAARRVARTISEGRHFHVDVDAAALKRVTAHSGGEPYFGRSGRNRFDCPGPSPHYGVTYCAPELPTAFAESVLHVDKRFDTRRNCWAVSRATVDASWVVDLQRVAAPVLKLFPLCGDLLTTMNIGNKVSAGGDYRATREISRVIHDYDLAADGILYVSNRRNLYVAVALFERSAVATQQLPGAYLPLAAHPDYAATLEAFDVIVV
jgi:hypothetical protein